MSALALPLLPAVAALALVALRGRQRALGPVAVGALIATLALGVWAAADQPAAGWRWSPAIDVGVAVSGFGRVMVVLVPLIAAPIVGYAAAAERYGRARLLALMLAFVGGMLLLVVAADFLSLLIAWELVGAASWALIGHDWRDPGNPRAAAQAFTATRVGDLGLYVAGGLTLAATGGLAFADLAGVARPALDVIAAGVLLAAAAKSAQVPFSPWLFSAMAGPTPVSALLHSATLVAAGAYLLVRLAPALAPVTWLPPAVAGLGLATALAGGIVAAVNTHAKRILAGSTSAQYGLMLLAVGAGSTAAAGAHLVAHAAFKSLLFLGAGVAIHAVGAGDVAGMRLGRALRPAAALSAVGALALAAVPPLGGAWTKERIVAAAAHESAWLAAGALAAGFLSALYAARYQLLAYGPGLDGEATASRLPRHRPGRRELAAMGALAAVTLVLSVLWLPRAAPAVEQATGGVLVPSAVWELPVALALIAIAAGLAWLLLQRGNLASLGLPARLQTAAGDWLGLPAAARALVVDPALALSRLLAGFDDRVIDAGVRAAAWLAAATSRLLWRRAEWSIDGVVHGVAAAAIRAAAGSRVTDERGIDAAVEGAAGAVGIAGRVSRKLQTGLAHHYYVLIAGGLLTSVIVLAVFG